MNFWRPFGHALSTGKDRWYEISGAFCSQAPYLSRRNVPDQIFPHQIFPPGT